MGAFAGPNFADDCAELFSFLPATQRLYVLPMPAWLRSQRGKLKIMLDSVTDRPIESWL